ncbi:MAG: LuxR C-terminal-related transcriptional regulator [Pseudomonadota bacterium]|nr:LuxR C-terminal-related transcriptional regulator [Pseudomonadota bacterium]
MLLTTKFLRPTPDPRSVQRQRLDQLLEPDAHRRINLVVAPAGYGKTTLVSQWLAGHGGHIAWLSLDDYDNQPRPFWQYVIGAFEHAGLIGLDPARQYLSREPGDDLTGTITALLNALGEDRTAWQLVLDDYHVIRDDNIHRQLAWFVDYLPAGVVVTLISRSEPPLPLARWRVRRQVRDIHPNQLAFSTDECRRFFHDTMGIPLPDADIQAICQRTEGWVAAMQLSALSGAATSDGRSPGAEPGPLAPDVRLISDYVLSEVLVQLPDELTGFLLETACCSRLCAPLCDSIRERSDSQAFLEQLLAQNLFLIPLDNENVWFRYHDLFRDALLQRFQNDSPAAAERLQQRCTDWLLSHGHVQEGLAMIASRGDTGRLATVLAEHGNNLIHGGYHLPVLNWLNHLPDSAINDSPQLLMLKVWALFFANRVDTLEPLLSAVEDLLDRRVADSHPDAEGALALHSEISLVRSYLARSRNDNEHAADLTRQVLKDIDQIQIPLKSVTYYGLGLDDFAKGELADAEEALASAVHYGRIERKASTALSSGGLLAWIQYHRGDTELALETTTLIRQWVDEHFSDPSRPRLISCWQNSSLTEIYRERNECGVAQGYLAPLLEHVEKGTEPGQHVVIQYVRGHLAFSQGQLDEAIDSLKDAEQVGLKRREHIVFEPPAASALLSRCYLAAGHIGSARECIEAALARPTSNPLNREQNQIAMARVLIAGGDPGAALELLSTQLAQAERNAHIRHLVEILLVTADALFHQDRSAEAMTVLDRALDRAESAGFLRLFAEESPALLSHLMNLPRLTMPGRWNRALLSLLKAEREPAGRPDAAIREPTLARTKNPAPTDMAEPLSQREQEVLKLIHQGLANKDIAEAMSVAPATVKAHIRNLYGKLGAGRRTEALARAREFGLLED